jgi:hypothetical protein
MGQRADDIGNTDPTTDDVVVVETEEFASNAGYDGALNGLPYSEGSPDLYGGQSNAYATDTSREGDFEAEQPDEIEITRIQIEQTRSELGSTIDAIQDRLSPANLKQQAKDTVREATIGKAQDMVESVTGTAQGMVGSATDGAKGFGSAIVETIRENPIPAALAGIGIGWLVMSGRKNSSSTDSYSYVPSRQYDQYGYSRQQDRDDQYRGYSYDYSSGNSGAGITDRASNMAGQAQDAAGSAVNSVQNTASDVAGQVQDTAGQMMDGVANTAGQLGQSAQQGYYQAQSGMQRMMNENPLAVGLMGLGLGAAIGLAIPATDTENELMGEQRDQLMDAAQSTVQEYAQKAQSVAQQTVGAAKDAAQNAAQDQGLTGSQPSASSGQSSKSSSSSSTTGSSGTSSGK